MITMEVREGEGNVSGSCNLPVTLNDWRKSWSILNQ